MGSSLVSTAASSEFLAVFRAHADATGAMSFARFMALALYHPQVGYYRREHPRVGYGPGTDFYTASSSGPLFGEMICAACATLLRGRNPRAHTFVEIGAETAGGVLAGVAHPFGAARTVRLGDEIELEGDCIVFSNELFDAQPCVATVARGGAWRELGVRLADGQLKDVELLAAENGPFTDDPPAEGYRFDRPVAATQLAERIAAQPWRGLFVAIDYGKTLRELLTACPAGTRRAYFQHTQSNDVLARPGEQDITCHVCWDWITEVLQRHGFAQPSLDFQESFFVRHAGDFLAAVSAAEAARLSPRKLALLQLLHPAHLGQKFQVLHALR